MAFSETVPTLSLDLDGCSYPYRVFVYDTAPDVEVGLLVPPKPRHITLRPRPSPYPQGPQRPVAAMPASVAGSTSAASLSSHHQEPLIAGRLASNCSDASHLSSHGAFRGVNHRLIEIFDPGLVSTFHSPSPGATYSNPES